MNISHLKLTSLVSTLNHWMPVIQWSCWVTALFLLAKSFWAWFVIVDAPAEFKPVVVSASTTQTSVSKVDVNPLVAMNLFGSAEKRVAVAEVVKTEAPETRLNLKLRGIFAAQTKSKANAIIEDGSSKQAVYFLDEKLDVSGQVFLREIFADRVILDTNGRRETLKLIMDDDVLSAIKSSEPEKPEQPAKSLDKRNNQRLSRQLNQYRDQFSRDPKSVADLIGGSPHIVDGELRGFLVSPGRDVRLFQELGLQKGDVVTSINGVSLTNMQDAMTLMNDAQSISELDIQIQRGEQSMNLLLNLNDKVGF